MPRLEPESPISHYKIKELIAAGGMGEVYRALDLQLGRVVALKTIRQNQAEDPTAYKRFLREARAASILSHPSICTVYEIGQEDELTFIAMQHIAGKTIQERLIEGTIPIENVLSYALDIVDALDEAHRHGVIHRDIKPSNIIINERDIAVVLDFGLATQISFVGTLNEELATLQQLTSATSLLGTAPYLPPEEIRGEPLDERSDIFSFGVTLYEMLIGSRPFDRPNKVDLLYAILHDEPKPLTEVRPDIDQRLEDIVNTTLRKDRSQRYQSAGQLKQELVAYVQEAGYVVRGVISTSAGARSTPLATGNAPKLVSTDSSTLTRGLLPFAFGLLVLILFIGVVWLLLARTWNRTDSNSLLSLRNVEIVGWKSEAGESDPFSSLSRDGKMVAYSSVVGGHAAVWIKQINGGNPIEIAPGQNPIWSPDNQQIAYVSGSGEQKGIWRVPSLGGTPRLVMPLRSNLPILRSWLAAGSTIYYELNANLFSVSATSGQISQLTNFNSSGSREYLGFSVSSNEDKIAYVKRENGKSNIFVMPTKGGDGSQITNDEVVTETLVWHPDGRRILYSALRDDTYQIFVAYVDGRPSQQITSGAGDKFVTDVSSDGSRILYGSASEEADIWAVRVDSGEESAVTSDVGSEFWPDVSPDNKLLAFQAINDPSQGRKIRNSEIIVKPIQSSGPEMEVARGSDPKWAPDSKHVAFVRFEKEMNIWTVGASGGEEKQITKEGIIEAGYSLMPYNRKRDPSYSWSPDGRKLAYVGETDSHSQNVSVIPADGNGTPQIINKTDSDRFYCPIWSASGEQITYFSSPDSPNSSEAGKNWKVWFTDLATGKSEVIFQSDFVLRLLGWMNSEKGVIVSTLEGVKPDPSGPANVGLIQADLRQRDVRRVAQLPETYLHNMQLSPDKQFLAFVSRQDGKDNVWIISIAGGGARRITANTDARLYFSSLTWSPDGKTIYYGRQSTHRLIWATENFK